MSDLRDWVGGFLQRENERHYGALIAEATASQASADREACDALEADFEGGGDCS